MNDPISARSTPQPGAKKSSRWLDVSKLSNDIKWLALDQGAVKIALKEDQRMELPHAWIVQNKQDKQRSHLTVLCTLRALHRGKRHTLKRRAFGPEFCASNGTAIIETPVPIPQWVMDKYSLNHPPEPLPGSDEAA